MDTRKTALTAGISLLIMALAAFFSYGFAHGNLVVQGDGHATFDNIRSSGVLFKAEILGWLIILICDIVVAWALYLFLKPIHPSLSLLGAWLRLIYAVILAMALLNLIMVSLLSDGKAFVAPVFAISQIQAQAMLFLETFESAWSMGLIFFGGHLLIVGYLAIKSNGIPKVIGILLLMAAIGYMAIHLCKTLLPEYSGLIRILEAVFMAPMIAGELGFGLWLLFRGKKVSTEAGHPSPYRESAS
ncbi:DUF4386 family protein [Cohnella sp. CFH 77786]|uniref:DUF4386 domain-containing protein n=1 Tax=Cohnella sp. CFH 77786 TaxID=2662265 RepID=UPI001C60B4AD|nr:DUF4386 domain-containing protein [Cohnella sp. CFH 77786]MBW5446124.1 DUF4386 family protein [Cohnella sp. CFH 77786]